MQRMQQAVQRLADGLRNACLDADFEAVSRRLGRRCGYCPHRQARYPHLHVAA